MKTPLLLFASHAAALLLGVGAGIYTLPILTAPPAPTAQQLDMQAGAALFHGEFRRDLKDSDRFHWGDGAVSVGRDTIALRGRLAPGPDYRLYLSPEFVETEADFLRLKPLMRQVGAVRSFDGFLAPLPPDVDPAAYTSVIVWCETFGQFITAARYR